MNYINEAKLNKILTITIIVLCVFIIACSFVLKAMKENSKQELKENNYRYSNVEDEVKLGYANLKSNENND